MTEPHSLVLPYTGHFPAMNEAALQSAYRVLQDSIIHYRGEPVGTMAACDPEGLAAGLFVGLAVGRELGVLGLVVGRVLGE